MYLAERQRTCLEGNTKCRALLAEGRHKGHIARSQIIDLVALPITVMQGAVPEMAAPAEQVEPDVRTTSACG